MKNCIYMIYVFITIVIVRTELWASAPEYLNYYEIKKSSVVKINKNKEKVKIERYDFVRLNRGFDELINSQDNSYKKILLKWIKIVLETRPKYDHQYSIIWDKENDYKDKENEKEKILAIPRQFDCTGLVALLFSQLMGIPYDYTDNNQVLNGEAFYKYFQQNPLSSHQELKERLTKVTPEEQGSYSILDPLFDLLKMQDELGEQKKLSYFIPVERFTPNDGEGKPYFLAQTGDILGWKDGSKYHAQIVVDGCVFVDMSTDPKDPRNFHRAVISKIDETNGKLIFEKDLKKMATKMSMQIRVQLPPGCIDGKWYLAGDGDHEINFYYRHYFFLIPTTNDGKTRKEFLKSPELNPVAEIYPEGTLT